MRRPLHLSRAPRREQGGFALFIVLIMMIVIAFLVVAATQSYNTEMRIGSNDADRKMAMATVLTTSEYSRIRLQPTIQAMDSPSTP